MSATEVWVFIGIVLAALAIAGLVFAWHDERARREYNSLEAINKRIAEDLAQKRKRRLKS